MRRLAAILSTLVLFAGFFFAASATARELRLSVAADKIRAGMPFALMLEASGFDEDPEPTVGNFEIPGAETVFLGVSPSVSSFVSIINGRRTARREVKFVYRYRVTASKPGSYEVPPITVSQGSVSESTQPSTFTAGKISSTPNMLVEMELPDRKIWVGETVPVKINWFITKNIADHTFVVPLFDMEDRFEVAAPSDSAGLQTLTFNAGSKEVELPFTRSNARKGNNNYTRFQFEALVTPWKAGTIKVPPTRVIAQMEVGTRRGVFGFPSAQTELFQAEDKPKTMTVLAMPEDSRPESFSGAIGTNFQYAVKADRTVVRMGDPIDLEVVISGNGRLGSVGMPRLSAEGALSPDLFSYSDEPPPGELLEDGSKRFMVSIRVKSDKVTEIPALPFSYFNPKKGQYDTVKSLPVALSVKGSAMVDASAVIASRSKEKAEKKGEQNNPGQAADASTSEKDEPGSLSLVGADLSLSDPAETLRRAAPLEERLPLIAALYLLPIFCFFWRVWLRKTADSRTLKKGTHKACKVCLDRIKEASNQHADEGGLGVANALKTLRAELGLASGDGSELIMKLEGAAFDPAARDKAVSAQLLDEAGQTVRRWETMCAKSTGVGATAIAFLLMTSLCFASVAGVARAATDADRQLDSARKKYHDALVEKDGDKRLESFASAALIYEELAREYPDRPELTVDWANASLGARNPGKAVLAYKRALALDPANTRASKGLLWIRNRMPTWLPVPAKGGATDSLLSWPERFSRTDRLTIGALAFAIALLLFTPWNAKLRTMRWIAILPAAIWLGLTLSVFLEQSQANAAVVIRDGAVVRSADSAGASPAFHKPLPAGAEVTVLEAREGWKRIELANGSRGWVRASEVDGVTD